jgi:hypothetical protein
MERALTGGEIGSDIFVTARRKIFTEVNCEKMSRHCDLKVMNTWAEYFSAKKGKFLFIYSESGGRRYVYIYDITTGTRIFKSDFSEPISFNAQGELSFWTEARKAAERECPSYNKWKKLGVIPIIETRVFIELSTLTLMPSEETRCSYKK